MMMISSRSLMMGCAILIMAGCSKPKFTSPTPFFAGVDLTAIATQNAPAGAKLSESSSGIKESSHSYLCFCRCEQAVIDPYLNAIQIALIKAIEKTGGKASAAELTSPAAGHREFKFD